MSMNKRIYGIIGISSKMANWNADFSGFPKTTSEGQIFASDKALKYPMKKMWSDLGLPILYLKSLRFSDNVDGMLIPRSLTEKYENLFNTPDLKAVTNIKEVITNLFSVTDVKQFGATFTEAGKNISITGAVQIGQGFNLYEDTVVEEQQILSPFRDASKDGKKQEGVEALNSTIGSKIISDEAHYFYPFNINPNSYREFVELGVTEGYTEEDYELFKQVATSSVTSFATNSKMGCDNEFTLFIETKPNVYIPELISNIKFKKGFDGEKNVIELKLGNVAKADGIENIEIYYNVDTTIIETDAENVKYYNIFTKAEV